VTAAASEAMEEFRGLAHVPDEVEISFGVVLDGKLGGVIASASASAHLDVTLRWHASRAPQAPPVQNAEDGRDGRQEGTRGDPDVPG
jgi:hypothetical protein